MTTWRLVADPLADQDIRAAVRWYEHERLGLGREFLSEIRSVQRRILDGPLRYAELRSGVRRASSLRFPYSVYFAVHAETIVVLAVLHTSRDPSEWQRRIQ